MDLPWMIPGTPPDPGSEAYHAQVAQIVGMVGQAADTWPMAEVLVVQFYAGDMSYHRGAISEALGHLERQFGRTDHAG